MASIPKELTNRDEPTSHEQLNHFSNSFSGAPVGAHLTFSNMKARLAANIGLHAVAGLCCFFPFWLTSYGTYERNWRGIYELNVWTPVVIVGFGCAIAAFVISFLGGRYICRQGSKWFPAVAFSVGFVSITLGSLSSWGDADGQWKLSVVGVPITLAVLALSYWGSTVGSRSNAHLIQ
jgi:hypothetical protein